MLRVRLSAQAVLFGLIVLAAVVFVPAASGVISSCKITDRSTGKSFTDLQAAVNAASPGATLIVQGTCTGTTTVATALTLKGRPSGSSPATLDGGGSGSVVTVGSGVRVAISSLKITGGHSTAGDMGGGITVNTGGTVTLKHSIISGNNAVFGGGIENNGGTVVVNDSGVINDTATLDGGGIDTYPAGIVSVRGASSISNNTAGLNGGGISNFDSGIVTLRGASSISNNTASGGGGGIYDACDNTAPCTGAVTLRNASRIDNNTAGGDGGGINNHSGGTITMTGGSRLYSNSAGGDGGGIFNNGTLIGALPGVNVYANTPDDVS